LFTQHHAYSKSVTDGLLASVLDEAFDGIDGSVANKLEQKTLSLVVSADAWTEESNEPYAYKVGIDSGLQIVDGMGNSLLDNDAVFELVNNQPVAFGKYGIVLNDVHNYNDASIDLFPTAMFEFLAVEKPTEDITLTILITAPNVILQREVTPV
jgi:hypothetical protein